LNPPMENINFLTQQKILSQHHLNNWQTRFASTFLPLSLSIIHCSLGTGWHRKFIYIFQSTTGQHKTHSSTTIIVKLGTSVHRGQACSVKYHSSVHPDWHFCCGTLAGRHNIDITFAGVNRHNQKYTPVNSLSPDSGCSYYEHRVCEWQQLS